MSDNYFGLNKLRKWRPDTYGVEKIQLEKFQNAVITPLKPISHISISYSLIDYNVKIHVVILKKVGWHFCDMG